ncbi:hypothetical protein D9M72_357380 [compost metagenome]
MVGGNPELGAVNQDRGILGAQVQQRLQGVARLLLRVGFQEAAQQQERGDHGGHLEVQSARTHLHAGVFGHAGIGQQLPGGEQVSGRDAEGDQGVHSGCEVPGVDGRGAVERPGRPRDHRQCQDPRHPAPVGELERRDHRNREHRDGEDGGNDEPRFKLGSGATVGHVVTSRGTAGGMLCMLAPASRRRMLPHAPGVAARGCPTGCG